MSLVDADHFRRLLSHFASGVTVVTTRDDAGRARGMTVSAFSSVSLEPPLILVCIEKDATLHGVLAPGTEFVVNILGADQEWVSRRFADPDVIDRFETVALIQRADGPPMLRDALARLTCTVTATHAAGDHAIVVGSVADGDVSDARPLIYFQSEYRGC